MLVCTPGAMNAKRKAAPYIADELPLAKRKQPAEIHQRGEACAEKVALEKASATNGMPVVRRLASLNAEVALSLMISESCDSVSPPLSPSEAFVALCSIQSHSNTAFNSSSEHSSSPTLPEKSASESTHRVDSAGVNDHEELVDAMQLQLSDSSEVSVASSVSGSDTEGELDAPSCSRTKPCLIEIGSWKKPRIEVVDCKRAISRVKRQDVKPSPVLPSGGYVRRLASLNARACVAAYLEPERSTRRPKSKLVSAAPGPVLSQPAVCQPFPAASHGDDSSHQVDEQAESLESFSDVEDETKKEEQLSALIASECKQVGVISTAHDMNVVLNLMSTQKHSQEEHGYEIDLEKSEDGDTFNTIGLLYDGGTVHPRYPVFLDREGELPSRIIPVMVPAGEESLALYINRSREQQRQHSVRPRAIKGDNGWICIGNAIKTITYKKGDVPTTRKYYIGISRRREEVFVRDCILVKAGRRNMDQPYVAKVASIWKENGCLMMTLFWYYRPKECDGINSVDFQEKELLASQHHDENSVACVEERCFVLGLRQYNRYCASKQQLFEGYHTHCETDPLVPMLSESGSLSHHVRGLPPNAEPTLVYLCCRGYNHIAEKLCK